MLKNILAVSVARWRSRLIRDEENLERFLREQSGKISGDIVIKYAQKRLGKLHYVLSRKDELYARELIMCQVKIHAEVVADMVVMTRRLLGDSVKLEVLQKMAMSIHRYYVNTAPQPAELPFCLHAGHFVDRPTNLRDLAHKTGRFIFFSLPVSEDLLPANVQIFRGQLRLAYIHFLEQFGKRAEMDSLRRSMANLGMKVE